MPKVSVVIPNYNYARFLRRRIQSVLDQTYRDFEVVFLDDASTDQSMEVFREFAGHPQVRSIVNQENSGSTFKQWNRGVAAATGEYVWIAEADDDAEPQFLAELVSRLEARPSAGIAYCETVEIDDDDKHIQLIYEKGFGPRWSADFVVNGREECNRRFVLRTTILNASGVVFRRRLYLDAGGADESMRQCSDWQLWMKMLMTSDLIFVAKPLNYWRKHTSSVRARGLADGWYEREDRQVVHFMYENLNLPRRAIRMAFRVRMARFMLWAGLWPQARRHAAMGVLENPWSAHAWRSAGKVFSASLKRRKYLDPTLDAD